MARQKMYVILHGVMRPKWIDLKDIYDKPEEMASEPVAEAVIAEPVVEIEPEVKAIQEEKPVVVAKKRGRKKKGQ